MVGSYVARSLGPDQYGLLNILTAMLAPMSFAVTFGLHSTVIREVALDEAGSKNTVGAAIVIQGILGLLIYPVFVYFAAALNNNLPGATALAMVIGLPLVLKFSEISISWFEGKMQSRRVIRTQLYVFAAFSLLKLLVLGFSKRIEPFAWLLLCEAISNAAALLVMLRREGFLLSHIKTNLKKLISVLLAAWPQFLSGLLIMIYMKLDQVLLGRLASHSEVGLYSSATRVSELWYFMPMAICSSVLPQIIKQKAMGDPAYKTNLQILLDVVAALSIVISLAGALLSNQIVMILYGTNFTEAATVLRIHIWSNLFVAVGVVSSAYHLAENRQILTLQRTLVGLMANFSLNLLLIPKFGSIGSAWACVITQFCVAFLVDVFQKETRHLLKMKLLSLNPVRGLKFLLGIADRASISKLIRGARSS